MCCLQWFVFFVVVVFLVSLLFIFATDSPVAEARLELFVSVFSRN